MALNLGELLIQLGVDSKEADRAEKKVKRLRGEVDKSGRQIERSTGMMSRGFGKLSKSINPSTIAIGGATAAVAALGVAITKSIKAFAEAEVQQVTWQQLLRQTNHASGQTTESLERFSRALGRDTLASISGARKAATELLTFTNITGDAFERTLKSAQDLAASGFGTLEGNVIQLGKALQDPKTGLSALTRVGISFNDQQKETIKGLQEQNKLFEAQAVLLEAIEAQSGGAGAAQGATFAGTVDTLGEEFGLFAEELGKFIIEFTPLTGALNSAAAAIRIATGVLGSFTSDTPRQAAEATIATNPAKIAQLQASLEGISEPVRQTANALEDANKKLEDAANAYDTLMNQNPDGLFGKDFENEAARLEGLFNEAEQNQIRAETQSLAAGSVGIGLGSEVNKRQEINDEILRLQQEMVDARLVIMQEEQELEAGLLDTELENARAHQEQLTKDEAEQAKKRKKIKEDELKAEKERAAGQRQVLQGMASNIVALTQVASGESIEAFRIYQAAQMGEATIAGISATLHAFEEGSKWGGPVLGFAFAATAAAATGAMIASIAMQSPPGRQFGGAVQPNRMYQVNETGEPEMLSTGGRDYLLMGGRGGNVTAAKDMKGGMTNNFKVDIVVAGAVDSDTIEEIEMAVANGIEQGTSQLAQTMQMTYSLNRSGSL